MFIVANLEAHWRKTKIIRNNFPPTGTSINTTWDYSLVPFDSLLKGYIKLQREFAVQTFITCSFHRVSAHIFWRIWGTTGMNIFWHLGTLPGTNLNDLWLFPVWLSQKQLIKRKLRPKRERHRQGQMLIVHPEIVSPLNIQFSCSVLRAIRIVRVH